MGKPQGAILNLKDSCKELFHLEYVYTLEQVEHFGIAAIVKLFNY